MNTYLSPRRLLLSASFSLPLMLSACADAPVDDLEMAEASGVDEQAFSQADSDEEFPILKVDIGFRTKGCDKNGHTGQNAKIKAAWDILYTDIRGALMPDFEHCIRSAMLVEASCTDLVDRQRIINALMADQFWDYECKVVPGEGWASGGVSIQGTKMRLDHNLLLESPERVASVMAHELMHNRGFRHAVNDVDKTPFYNLTVPEQVEQCVLVATGLGSSPNQPIQSLEDPMHACNGAAWCDATDCYHNEQVIVDHGAGGVSVFVYTYDSAGNMVRLASGVSSGPVF